MVNIVVEKFVPEVHTWVEELGDILEDADDMPLQGIIGLELLGLLQFPTLMPSNLLVHCLVDNLTPKEVALNLDKLV